MAADERELTESEDHSSREGWEDVNDVPPEAKDIESCSSYDFNDEDRSPHGTRDNSDGLGDGRGQSPRNGESILAKLADGDTTPEELDSGVAKVLGLVVVCLWLKGNLNCKDA